jgi:diguanylate cyclase (GGDEF)-like protein/PAS domain S-box-containing protein
VLSDCSADPGGRPAGQICPDRLAVLNVVHRHADTRSMTDIALLRVLDAAGVATATLDAEGRVLSASPSFARAWNRSADELCGAHLVGLCPEHEQPEVLAALVRMLEGVVEFERHDLRLDPAGDEPRVVRLTFGPVTDESGTVVEVVAVLHDVTAPHRAERRRRRRVVEMTRQATHDPVTGLPNRRAFDAMLGSALRRSARTGYPFSLMRVDVDGLDALLGELDPVDAAALVEVYTSRLAQRLRPSDDVCRTEGDSFMVLAEDLGDVQDAAGVAYRLLSTVVEPIKIGEREIRLPMTIGIVVADGNGGTDDLARTADAALSEARQDGVGGFRIIDVRSGLAA